MKEEQKPTLEQMVDSQASGLVSRAKEKRYKTVWDASGVKKALQLFHPLFEETQPDAVYAGIGPCPEPGDDCGADCAGPNTLTFVAIFDKGKVNDDYDKISRIQHKCYETEGQWMDHDERLLSIIPKFYPYNMLGGEVKDSVTKVVGMYVTEDQQQIFPF